MHNWYVDIPGYQGKFDLKHSHFVPKKQITASNNSSIEKMISSHHFGGWVPAYMNGLCGSASLRLAFHCQGSQAGMDRKEWRPRMTAYARFKLEDDEQRRSGSAIFVALSSHHTQVMINY